jgi:hypothetical protein
MRPDPDEPDLPESLKNRLISMYRADVRASAEIDRAILNRARAQVARQRRLRIFAIAAGVAAAILIAIAILPSFKTDHGSYAGRLSSNNAQHAGDVNGDGVVDIRDALILQRAIESGMKSGIDVNHDGVTDRRDVDAIAAMAVSLAQDLKGVQQ